MREVCALSALTRVLLTGCYPLAELPQGAVALCPVPDAPSKQAMVAVLREYIEAEALIRGLNSRAVEG